MTRRALTRRLPTINYVSWQHLSALQSGRATRKRPGHVGHIISHDSTPGEPCLCRSGTRREALEPIQVEMQPEKRTCLLRIRTQVHGTGSLALGCGTVALPARASPSPSHQQLASLSRHQVCTLLTIFGARIPGRSAREHGRVPSKNSRCRPPRRNCPVLLRRGLERPSSTRHLRKRTDLDRGSGSFENPRASGEASPAGVSPTRVAHMLPRSRAVLPSASPATRTETPLRGAPMAARHTNTSNQPVPVLATSMILRHWQCIRRLELLR